MVQIGKSQIQGGAPNNFLHMKNERLVAPFQSTVTRFRSQDPDRRDDAIKQAGIANSLHGLASAGQEAMGSGYGSQQSFFSRSEPLEAHFTHSSDIHRSSLPAERLTSFGRVERFGDPTTQKNFRIGPKQLGPNPTTYHTYQGGFVQKKSYNLRFL